MPPPNALVIRCFAAIDEGLVDEWPVAVDVATLHALVPAAKAQPTAIHEVTAELASKLAARTLGPYPEEVAYFLEPATLDDRE